MDEVMKEISDHALAITDMPLRLGGENDAYPNPTEEERKQVWDMLNRMTIQEKRRATEATLMMLFDEED